MQIEVKTKNPMEAVVLLDREFIRRIKEGIKVSQIKDIWVVDGGVKEFSDLYRWEFDYKGERRVITLDYTNVVRLIPNELSDTTVVRLTVGRWGDYNNEIFSWLRDLFLAEFRNIWLRESEEISCDTFRYELDNNGHFVIHTVG